MSFCERLSEYRRGTGFNQTEFARIIGISKTTQVNYETGKRSPNVDYLQAISAIGADVQYILTGIPSQKAEDLSRKDLDSVELASDKSIRENDPSKLIYKNSKVDLKKPLTNAKTDSESVLAETPPSLTPREAALLDNYRHIPDKEDQGLVERMALLAARPAKEGSETTGTAVKKVNE